MSMQNTELANIYKELVERRAIPVGFASEIVESTGINDNSVRAVLNGNQRVYVSDESKEAIKKAAIQILFEKSEEIRRQAHQLQNTAAPAA